MQTLHNNCTILTFKETSYVSASMLCTRFHISRWRCKCAWNFEDVLSFYIWNRHQMCILHWFRLPRENFILILVICIYLTRSLLHFLSTITIPNVYVVTSLLKDTLIRFLPMILFFQIWLNDFFYKEKC